MLGVVGVEPRYVLAPRSTLYTPYLSNDAGGYYVLLRRKRSHRRATSLGDWSQHYEHDNRHLVETTIGAFWISTIFLGLDHSFGHGPPMLYETMVFKPTKDESGRRRLGNSHWCDRASTWDEAEAKHAEAVTWVRLRVN